MLLCAFPLNLQSWLVSTSISKQQTCLLFQTSFTTLVRDPQNICHSVLLLFFSLPTSLKGHLTPASFSSSLQTPCLAFTVLALPYPLAWKCSSKVTNCFLEITEFGGPLLIPFSALGILNLSLVWLLPFICIPCLQQIIHKWLKAGAVNSNW